MTKAKAQSSAEEQQPQFMEPAQVKEGMRVEYSVANRKTTGVVKRVFLEDGTVDVPHEVHADHEHPVFLIENDHTGKLTLHKMDHLDNVMMTVKQHP